MAKKREAIPPTAPPPGYDPWAPVLLPPEASNRVFATVLLEAEDLRPSWHQRAACRGQTATFFAKTPAAIETAKAVCAGCPVRTRCDAMAVAGDDVGVWAGRTQQERRRAVRRVA